MGSTDGTVNILKEEYPDIRLIETKGCLVEAHNLGIKKTDGEFFLRVDDDLELDKKFISELVKIMEKDKTIGISGGKIYYHKTDQIWCVGGKVNFRTGGIKTLGIGEKDKGQYDFLREVDYIGSLMFTRRDVFDKAGPLDMLFSPLYYEDIEFCVRTRKNGYRVVFVPSAIAYHYIMNRKRSLRRAWLFQTHRLKFLLKYFGEKSVV
jgi:GT2 family glycosyltransferase